MRTDTDRTAPSGRDGAAVNGGFRLTFGHGAGGVTPRSRAERAPGSRHYPPADTISAAIRVTDRNEPGHLLPSTGRPAMGETRTAQLADPDGIAQKVRWRWERSGGRDEWLAIPGAEAAVHTATGHWLRVTAEYEVRLGGPRQHVALLSEPVLRPTLATLATRTDNGGSET